MKRFLCFIAAIFTMLVYCAAPLKVYADDVNVSYDFYSYEHLDSIYCPNNTDRYFKFQALWDSGSDQFAYTYGIYLDSSDYDNTTVTVSDDVTTINFPKVLSMWSCYNCYDKFGNKTGTKPGSVSLGAVTIRILKIYNNSHKIEAYYSAGNLYATYTLYDINSNFDFFSSDPLNLSVSFNPVLSGAVSRTSTIDGKEYTSNTLDLCVSNNGKNAQFAWFIVPKGVNVSFPTSLLDNSQGFDGSPTFAYVTDEWTGFQISGLQGNSLYAPCAWHTVPSGYKNQYYHVAWSQMYLTANTQYDVVVYACLNQLTDVSDRQVDADLTSVEEIYRSTFSLTDPAEFSPTSDAFGVHPWNPNVDNKDLFNVSSGYKDDNGNIVIKGQSKGGYVIGGDFINDVYSQRNSINVNNYFGSFFGFFRCIFSYFPSSFIAIITSGLITIVIIGIIKAVT